MYDYLVLKFNFTYDYYNGCSLLKIEYFNPDGCDCVDEDGNIIEEELEKILKYK